MPRPIPTRAGGDLSTEALAILLAVTSTLENERERARLIATGISSVIACPFAGVGLRQEDGDWIGFFDLPDGTPPMTVTEMESIDQAASGRRSRQLDASHHAMQPLLARYGIGALMVYPLATRHRSHGLLMIGLGQGQTMSPEQGHACQLLTSTLALGIENLRLTANLQGLVARRTEDLRAAEARQRALLQLTNSLVRNLDRTSLLKAISQTLGDIIPFDRASLALLDSTGNFVELHAVSGSLSHPQVLPVGNRLLLSESVLESLVREKQPRLRNDLEMANLVAEEQQLYELGVRSYVFYPLCVRDRVIGSLNLSSRRPHAYHNADVDLVGEVAAQVALAVANMLTYEEIESLRSRAEQENVYLKRELESEQGFREIVGRSPRIRSVLSQVQQVAATTATVLICGETGTGKELIARAIHEASDRRERALVKVNCAAISAGLVESELFGHEKGSFTGAVKAHVGRFEFADGGTLFLDEVGELPLDTQVKLLRVLQEGEFERVGSNRPIKVDVRLVAATNRDLQKAAAAGEFRSDLYYRLSVFPLYLAPLRERRDDIPLLCEHLLARLSHKLGKPLEGITRTSLEQLMDYPWPGNIRELQNILERAAILSPGTIVEIGDLLPTVPDVPEQATAPPEQLASLDEAERNHILRALAHTNWAIAGPTGAAALLDINPNTLRSRMKKLGITKVVTSGSR